MEEVGLFDKASFFLCASWTDPHLLNLYGSSYGPVIFL